MSTTTTTTTSSSSCNNHGERRSSAISIQLIGLAVVAFVVVYSSCSRMDSIMGRIMTTTTTTSSSDQRTLSSSSQASSSTSSSSRMVVDEIIQLNKEHQQWLKRIASYGNELNITNLLRGNVVHEQVLAYRHIAQKFLLHAQAQQPPLRAADDSQQQASVVVCETGFFQGVSSHLWMDSLGGGGKGGGSLRRNSTTATRKKKKMTLHSFDLEFPEANVAKLREMFSRGGRGTAELVLHPGNTRDTLSSFQPKKPCNLLSIDGSHNGFEPYMDLVDLLPSTKCGSIVLYDDTFDPPLTLGQEINTTIFEDISNVDNNPSSPTFFNYCSISYWRAVKEGLIEHINCQDFGKKPDLWGPWPKGYCVAIAKGGNCIGQN